MVFSLGLDVDGTLFDVLTPLLSEINLKYGKNFKHSDVIEYSAHKCLGITKNELYDILNDIWFNKWLEVKPYELNIADQINKLRNNGHNIIIVTKRDLKTIINVINLLKKWRITVDGIVCLNNHLKKTLIDVDYMIDDSKEITDMFGSRGLLLKRPYNKEYDIESIGDFTNKLLENKIKVPERIDGFIIGAGT